MHMIRIRLVYAAEVCFIHMVDAEPRAGMQFPVKDVTAVVEGGAWRDTFEAFNGCETVIVGLESWPVRVFNVGKN
jgi:hypothetical protein